MKKIKHCFSIAAVAIFACNCGAHEAKVTAPAAKQTTTENYSCLPCGQSCDTITSDSAGNCATCKMELVKKSSIVFNKLLPQDLYVHIGKTGSNNILLLDVRTPAEFNGKAEEKFSRLKNAINIPVQELASRLKELEKYKDKEIIVYCSHSHRSPMASYLLTQNGFDNVTNMEHGMHMWKQDINGKIQNDWLYIAQ